jgi:hypothetical protein
MVLPFMKDAGWNCEVLAATPQSVSMPIDAWMEEGIPDDIPVHRVQPSGLRWAAVPGFGSLDVRALRVLRRTGDELLRSGRFDVVYFSTTAFGLHVLGPYWRRRHNVPFVMDYQDPWVTDYYRDHPDVIPPGGRLKYAVADCINRFREPRVLKHCSGITTVSEKYPKQLQQRYPFTSTLPATVLPFPGAPRDLQRVIADGITQQCFDPDDGREHWVYVGVSGPIMRHSLSALFAAIRSHTEEHSEFLERTRLHFIGTSYAAAGTADPVVLPIAQEFGLDCIVHEQTDRVAYSEATRCLVDADALLVPGSDEPGYNASKLFPYLLARKPTLVIFHRESPVHRLVSEVAGATLVGFRDEQTYDDVAAEIRKSWLDDNAYHNVVPLNEELILPYTDHGQSRVLCEFFNLISDQNGAA